MDVCSALITVPVDPNHSLEKISTKVYSTRHGLPSSVILSITQDKHGFLWICTEQGLVRYDGDQFYVLDSYPPNVDIYTVSAAFDSKGRLWVATGNALLVYSGNKFKRITLNDKLDSLLMQLIISPDDDVWILDTSSEVFRLHNEKLIKVPNPDGKKDAVVFSLALDPSGHVWAAGSAGVFKWTDGYWKQVIIQGMELKNIEFITLDSGNSGWCCNRDQSVYRFTGNSSWSVKLPSDEHNPAFVYYSMASDSRGGVWIGTSKGLYSISGKNVEHFTVSTGLSSNLIFYVYFDREGILWYGSDNGLGKISGLQFRQIKLSGDLPLYTVHDIIQDSQDRIWAGTSEGLVEWDKKTIRRWTTNDGLPSDFIFALAEMPDHDIVFASEGELRKIHDNQPVKVLDKKFCGLFSAFDMKVSSCGELWLTGDFGLLKLQDKSLITMNEQLGLNKDVKGHCLLFDNQNRMWLATQGDGVYYSDHDMKKMVKIEGLPSEQCFSVFQDSKERIWISTLKGAVQLIDNEVRVVYTRRYGLNSENIWSIQEDSSGNIWLATSQGLACIRDGRIFNYDVDDGVSCDDFIDNCAMKDSRNRIWFGGSGVTIVNSDYLLPVSKPKVYIKYVRSGNRLLSPGSRVPHNQNNLEFVLGCISYLNEARNKFRYQLIGFDKYRSNPVRSAFVRYTNLPTGRYKMVADAMNRDGEWSAVPAEFQFEILPAWWESVWVRLIALMILLLLIYLVIAIRSIQIRRRARELQREVDRKTKVIQKQLRDLEKQKEKLEHLAITDDLTGLSNRRFFFRVLTMEWKRQARYHRPLSLILFDIDHFKEINDTYGHAMGDQVLIAVANTIANTIRAPDTVARFGGEEFIVLLPETELQIAREVAERIRLKVVNMKIEYPSIGKIDVRISGGVSTQQGVAGAMNPDGLIRQADIALYRAKNAGRNRIEVYGQWSQEAEIR